MSFLPTNWRSNNACQRSSTATESAKSFPARVSLIIDGFSPVSMSPSSRKSLIGSAYFCQSARGNRAFKEFISTPSHILKPNISALENISPSSRKTTSSYAGAKFFIPSAHFSKLGVLRLLSPRHCEAAAAPTPSHCAMFHVDKLCRQRASGAGIV